MSRLRKPRAPKTSQRLLAFTRLAEHYKYRSRPENASSDLQIAMEGQPQVTAGLKEAPGGIEAVLNALRAFDSPDAQAFMALYDSFTVTDRKELTLEEFAVAADLGSSRLLGLAVEALRSYGQSVSQVILWAGMPNLVKKSMKMAALAKGGEDRDRLFKAAAFVPVPKSSTVAVQVNNQIPVQEEKQLRPWNAQEQLEAIQGAFAGAKQLPAALEHEDLSPTLDALQSRTTDILDAD